MRCLEPNETCLLEQTFSSHAYCYTTMDLNEVLENFAPRWPCVGIYCAPKCFMCKRFTIHVCAFDFPQCPQITDAQLLTSNEYSQLVKGLFHDPLQAYFSIFS